MRIYTDSLGASHNCHRGGVASHRAFTLVEVLISIVLVLMIILGVNQVFALTSLTVGAGQALSNATREARNAQSIFASDFANMEIDRAPFLWIESRPVAAFRNRVDQLNDRDYTPTATRTNADPRIRSIDRDGDGAENLTAGGADLTPLTFLTSRTHRADTIKFFTRQRARRQTGEANVYSSNMASTEQYITYGHLRQPDNVAATRLENGKDPGIGFLASATTPVDNPNNFYATQWVLGRVVFLLREPEVVGTNRFVYDYSNPGSPVPMTYYGRTSGYTDRSTISPMSENAESTINGSSGTGHKVQWTYHDVMGFGMENFRNNIMVKTNNATTDFFTLKATWHDENNIGFRFTGSPTPDRPLSPLGVARTVPCFVRQCTQFVVEYAGDFTTQDPTGNVTSVGNNLGEGVDGAIDYNVTGGKRSVRWYGFPRDTTDDGKILAGQDVVPLRDYIGSAAAFERSVLPKTTNTALGYGHASQVRDRVDIYRVAWAADTAGYPRPKMLRIVMAVDDPAARIGSEQLFEYVFEVP